MNQNELNTQLYEKMLAEQEQSQYMNGSPMSGSE